MRLHPSRIFVYVLGCDSEKNLWLTCPLIKGCGQDFFVGGGAEDGGVEGTILLIGTGGGAEGTTLLIGTGGGVEGTLFTSTVDVGISGVGSAMRSSS